MSNALPPRFGRVTVRNPRRVLPQGFFTNSDIAEYRALVRSLPDGARMVEVGVWLGRSLCSVSDLIIKKGIHVIAVDMGVKKRALGHAPPRLGQQETFLRNMRKVGIEPECLWMSSFEAAALVDPVDFTFLDDDHRYEYVQEELSIWLPKTKLLIGGHDYNERHDELIGVKRAVDERFENVRVGGMVWSAKVGHV